MKAQTMEQKAHIAEQNDRQAQIRLQRNDERKTNYAMMQVLNAHNVDFDPLEANLSGLEIEKNTGNILGNFEYEAKMPSADIPRASGKVETLTLDDIPNMTADQINARWDEIMELSKAGAIN